MVKRLEKLFGSEVFEGREDLAKGVLGIEGYKKFRSEMKEVDNSRPKNRIFYGSRFGRIQDGVYEFFQLYEALDSKRAGALEKINKVQELEENSEKYLNGLSKLVRAYDLFVSGNKMKLLDESDDLEVLEQDFVELKEKYSKFKIQKNQNMNRMI